MSLEAHIAHIEHLLGADAREAAPRDPAGESAERLVHERTALFRSAPAVLAHSSEIARPGDFVTRDLAGLAALAVRDRAGQLRAFANICRHRGAPVVEASSGSGCSALVCPYHGWVYQLDGALVHVPGEAFFPGLNKSDLGLEPIPLTVAHGFVWTGPEAALDEPLDEPLAHLDLAQLTLAHSAAISRPRNWKTVVEGLLAGSPSDDWPDGDQIDSHLIFPSTIAIAARAFVSILAITPESARQTHCRHYLLARARADQPVSPTETYAETAPAETSRSEAQISRFRATIARLLER